METRLNGEGACNEKGRRASQEDEGKPYLHPTQHKNTTYSRFSRASGLQPHELPDWQAEHQSINDGIGKRHDGIEKGDVVALAEVPAPVHAIMDPPIAYKPRLAL